MGIDVSKIINRDTYDMPVHVDKDNPLVKKIQKARDEMTGWDRIKMIFVVDDMGEMTPELTRCRDATLFAFMMGSIIGAVGRSRIAYMDFMRTNYQEAFTTPLKAKEALQQKVTLGMMSGGFRIGWRCAVFTGLYISGSTLITAYRNKMGILDQVGGGAMAGFLFKFKDGPKAMVAGTAIGGSLGLVAGTMTYGVIRLTGYKLEEANLWYYENVERRKQRQYEIMLKGRKYNAEEGDLLEYHQSILGEKSKALDNIPDVDQTNQSKSSSETDGNIIVNTKVVETNNDVKTKTVINEQKPTVIQQPVVNANVS